MQKKSSEKVFCFLDKCMWIDPAKVPLLRREYLSSAVNVLTISPKILHITKRNSIVFTVIKKYGKGASLQIVTVFGTVYHIACWRVFWNGTI